MDKGVITRSMKSAISTEEDFEDSQEDRGHASVLTLAAEGVDTPEPTLLNILKELRDFRKDNNEQYSDIKHELKRVNDRVEEAECRIEESETVLQAVSGLISKLTERQVSLEARLVDQEGRARRDNLRIYGIAEDKEGADMVKFLDNMLKNALGFSNDSLGIERAHRALIAKPNAQAKPRSIVVKFGSYRMKEEVLRRAWQKKEVFCDGVRFFVDHDYPIEVLKQRNEYREAKKVLREKRIKFQTPYPSKMRVFYDNGTRLYKDAAEATRDMAARGLPVSVVKPAATPDQEELQLLSAWRTARGHHHDRGDHHSGMANDSTQDRHRARFREKLQVFRRDIED